MKLQNIIYIILVALMGISLLLDFACEMQWITLPESITGIVTSPIALAIGLVFALVFGKTFPDFTKLMSKKLLQYSVIGLGFGMSITAALESGKEGMLFTIVSVFGTLALGWIVGAKLLKVDWQTSYLISSGTAICGGSAIAATGPVIKARAESMSVALGVVFILNAIALFIFPSIGDAIGMSMKEFGMWAAIAIHDTSSVVGAGAAYDAMHPDLVAAQGVSALETATTIKLTRALWIVVLALCTPFFFRKRLAAEDGGKQKPWYKTIPMFIIYFIIAILVSSYILRNEALLGDYTTVGTAIGNAINRLAKHCITLSLFFIGAGLTRETLRAVGIRPLIQGVTLWILISVISLTYILYIA